MAAADKPKNGAPTSEGAKLVEKDYREAIGDLGQQRVISRNLLARSVGQFDPEVISWPRLYQMRKDPMIQMGLHYCKFPLIRGKWHIECEDAAIAAGVTEIIKRQYGPYMRTFLNMLDFGFQAGIKQFQLGDLDGTYDDPKTGSQPIWKSDNVQPVLLAPPLPLMPEFAQPHIDKGVFAGIDTSSILGAENIEDNRTIPPEWCIWTTNEFEESFRNYFGYPRTGYAYRYWWSYWFRFHMEDRHFEMDADPPLVVSYPVGTYTDENGDEQKNRTAALKMGDDLRGGATIAKPSDVFVDDQGKSTATSLWDAEFLQGGENLGAFRQSLEYLDVMKLRACLVPEQALVEGKGGTSSRNVAATYADIFQESLGQTADDLDDYWNSHIIPQIVEANWGADAPRCRKVSTGFEEEDMTLANELIKIAFNLDPNALPINFEELIVKANLPSYSAKEQEDRQKEAQAQQQEQQAQQAQAQQDALAAQADGNPQDPNTQQAQQQLSLDQEGKSVFFAQSGRTVPARQPAWARAEYDKRVRNQQAIQERIQAAAKQRYETAFQAAAAYLAHAPSTDYQQQEDGELPKHAILFLAIRHAIRNRSQPQDDAIRAELASAYHAAGAAELQRLDMDLSSWDVGRLEIQEYANKRAGELITTIDETVVDQHLRPWLAKELQEHNSGYPGQTPAPIDTIELAQKLSDKFEGYPLWMSERLARTESRMGYNGAALDMYERVGITEVQAYDGQGGKSGKSDPECLERNGQIMDLSEARAADAAEHPNGTLGFVPYVDPANLQELGAGALAMDAVKSDSIYAVDADGLLLSEAETGSLLAGETRVHVVSDGESELLA